MTVRALAIAGAVVMLAIPASAHHSFAMFDYNKGTTIKGEVKELRWVNPHIHILVNVPDGKGGVTEWDIEGGTPANLRNRGWSRTVVKPGEKISILIYPMKDGSAGGELVRAHRADGTQIGRDAGQ